MDKFICKITALKCRFNFSVTSWFRTVKRNTYVGGVPNSMHLYGLAVDVALDDSKDTKDFKQACWRLKMKCLDEGDHLHIQIM